MHCLPGIVSVSEGDAHEMLSELRSKVLLGSFRGEKVRDMDALVRAICGLSEIFTTYSPFFADLEVNPLIVGAKGEGVWAVDVRPVWR